MIAFSPQSYSERNLPSFPGPQNSSGRTAPGNQSLVNVKADKVAGVDLTQTLNRAYQKLESKALTGSAAGAPAKLAPESGNDFSPQSVTDRIMGFIEQRLEKEKAAGASDERIQSLYKEALKGVEQGLREAKEIIQSTGLLKGEVEENFNTTTTLLADRLETLGESLFATPSRSGGHLQSERLSVAERRDFNMEVVTQDGDRVRLTINSGRSASQQAIRFDGGGVSASLQQADFSRYDNLSFQVEGELDEGEMKALSSLFKQVNAVADTFYQGNVDQALEQALNVGMNGEELAAFAVDLQQAKTTVMERTYASVASGSDAPTLQPATLPKTNGLGQFANQVKEAKAAVSDLISTLPNAQQLFEGLLGTLSTGSNDNREQFSQFLGSIH